MTQTNQIYIEEKKQEYNELVDTLEKVPASRLAIYASIRDFFSQALSDAIKYGEERKEKIDENALEEAARKLRRLRLTDVFGEKDIPQETVKSALQRGLGGLYEDEAIVYILRFGIKYYLAKLATSQEEKI